MTTLHRFPSLPAGLVPDVGRPLSLAELIELVRDVSAREPVWLPRLLLPEAGADRWWTRLHAGTHVDVWLLSWLPGHTTELHDHGDSAAAFTVLRGRLDEVRLGPGQRALSALRAVGSSTWIAPGVAHDVRAIGTDPAVSLHAYSPPLTRMTYWAADAAGVLRPARTVSTSEPEEELQR